MKTKALFLITWLFTLVIEASPRNADIRIRLSSVVEVLVAGNIVNLNVSERERGFDIPSAIIKVDDFSTKPALAKSNLKKEKMLDSRKYPFVEAKNITCDSLINGALEGDCKGSLRIKGIEKAIEGARYKMFSDGKIEIHFNFYLSDFNISNSIFVWNIDNKAEAIIKVRP